MSEARIRLALPGLMHTTDGPVARAVTVPASRQGPRQPGAVGILATIVGVVLGVATTADEPRAATSPHPEQGRLESVVRKLASPEMEGRRGEGGRRAAAFLVEEFRELKLEPLFAGQFVQEIPASEPGRIQGRNVGAALRGSDPALRDEWVILAAHFDHLGVREGVLYPGADDNGSGVAMMLEVARSFAEAGRAPRRSLMFIGFDLEEVGLFGSRYFAAHPPVPLGKIALFITADMIGRSFGGVCRQDVFVLGTEHAPALRGWIDAIAKDRPLKVGLLGSDLLVLNRSDYGPFRSRQVPFLFFTTGENPRYHSPQDTPDSMDYPKLATISQVIHELAVTATNADTVPRWSNSPDNPLAEAITIRDVLRQLIENREALGLGAAQMYLMNSTLHSLDGIVARGAITPGERAALIQAARIVLFTIR